MSEDNHDLVRAVETAWDQGRMTVLDQYFSPDFRSHETLTGMPPTLEMAKGAHHMAIGMFPDRRIILQAVASEGDYVFVRNKVTGTDPGGALFRPRLPGRGERPFEFDWWSIYRIDHGKVAEQWGLPDIKLATWQMRLNLLRGLTTSVDPGSTDFPIAGEDLLLPHALT